MRIRLKLPALLKKRASTGKRFAWKPKKMPNGTFVWLEMYRRFRSYDGHTNADSDQHREVVS